MLYSLTKIAPVDKDSNVWICSLLENVKTWRVARNSQKGGGTFLEAENNRKRTRPKFSSVLNQIDAVFLSKSGVLKKKVFTKIETVFPAEIR